MLAQHLACDPSSDVQSCRPGPVGPVGPGSHTMQDANTQHDQSAAAEMLKAGMNRAAIKPRRPTGSMKQVPAAAAASSSRSSKAPLAVTATEKEQAVGKVSHDAAEAPEDDCMQKDGASAPAATQPARAAAAAAAPARKKQRTAGKKAPARNAKQAAAEADTDSDAGDDADESDTAAAADAAHFTAGEVTEVRCTGPAGRPLQLLSQL